MHTRLTPPPQSPRPAVRNLDRSRGRRDEDQPRGEGGRAQHAADGGAAQEARGACMGEQGVVRVLEERDRETTGRKEKRREVTTREEKSGGMEE
jgi:hypothetical protein